MRSHTTIDRLWLLSLPFLAFLVLPLVAMFLRLEPGQLWQNLGQYDWLVCQFRIGQIQAMLDWLDLCEQPRAIARLAV